MLNIMHSRIQQLVRFSYENTHATCLQVYSPKCGEQASFQLRQAQKLFQMRKASFQSRQAQKLFFGSEFYAQPNSAVMIQLIFLPRARTCLQVNSPGWHRHGLSRVHHSEWLFLLLFTESSCARSCFFILCPTEYFHFLRRR